MPLRRCAYVLAATAMLALSAASPAVGQSVSAFADSFERPDSQALLNGWIERGELASEYSSGGYNVGPAVVELSQRAMAFRYRTHSLKLVSPYNAINASPLAYVRFSSSNPDPYPFVLSFAFVPHADARMSHEIGLMNSDEGFVNVPSRGGVS